MNRTKSLSLVILITFFSLLACTEKETMPEDSPEETIINHPGFIQSFVATRGNNQWLIGVQNNTDIAYYFDDMLAAEYHIDSLQIEFRAVLENDSTIIYKPMPNDGTTPNFKVRNIRILDVQSTVQ